MKLTNKEKTQVKQAFYETLDESSMKYNDVIKYICRVFNIRKGYLVAILGDYEDGMSYDEIVEKQEQIKHAKGK